MSTGRRGHRGVGDRGGRGGRGNSNPFRGGGSTRGRFNGTDATMRDTSQDAHRGGRGGTHARAEKPLYRGRGGQARGNAKFTAASPASGIISTGAMNSTPFPEHEYAKRLEYLRNDRPRLREELVRRRLMNPDGPMNLADSVELHGICTDMCPEYERVRRIVENDYKAAECTPETAHGPRAGRVPDETRMVKAFTRSAAGQEEELVSDKRTPATCLKTLDYMFRRIDEDGLDFLYQWLWDRTRSVRKDMVGTIKPEDIPSYLTSVEQCARFHLVSLHEMAGSKSPNYDHNTDHGNDLEQLRNCFTSLRHRYDDNEQAGVINAHKAEFTAYDLILSLVARGTNTQLEDNPERCRDKFPHHPRVQAAYVIRQAGLAIMAKVSESFPTKKQNWANFWQAVNEENVSFLMACAAEISFNQIRHHVMETLRMAYKPKKSGKPGPANDWTPEHLMHALGFDDHDQVKEFCGHYGLGFIADGAGDEVLDLQSMPQGKLEKPPEMRPQYFSRDIVEPKRLQRSFLDVIQTNLKENDQEQGDSLFVSESSMNRSLNPNATAFKPPAKSPFSYMSNTASKPSIFASATQNATGSAGPSIQPGVFDPSRNTVKFADSPFSKPASVPAPSSNVFPNNATFPSASTTPASATFNFFTAPSTEATSTPAASNFFTAPSTTTTNQASPGPAKSGGFVFSSPSQPDKSAQEEERRKAEEEQKRKLEEQKRAAEEQKRAQEEQIRQARAAEEHRRLQEEQQRQRLLQEEQERQRRIQEEAYRQAQAERQRQMEAEQLQRDKEEAERYEREEKARAYSTLTDNLFLEEDEGLLKQFLENKVQSMIKEVARELEEERLKQWAEDRYQEKRLAFTRAVCARWWEQVQKKKKRAAARRRREQLKALRASTEENSHTLEVKAPIQNNGIPDGFKKPDVPASARRTDQPKARDGTTSLKKVEQPVLPKQKMVKRKKDSVAQPSATSAEGDLEDLARSDYSEAYYKSTAPIDRTETDWFKLRAMGLDPNEHRKRNHESVSSGEEDENIDTKRARRSTSSSFRRSLPPPKTDEERIARFRALQDSFNRGSATPRSTAERHRSASVISQARDALSRSPVPQLSRSEVSNFRRSLSSSGFANPPPQLSMFGRSIGASAPGEAAAYKSRTSRFVPAHLYGKGGDAARAYREECRMRLSAGSSNEIYNSTIETSQIRPEIPNKPVATSAVEESGVMDLTEDDEDMIVYSSSDVDEKEPEENGTQIVYRQQQVVHGIDDEEDDDGMEDEELEEEEENENWDAYDEVYDDEEAELEEEEDYDDEEDDEEQSFSQQAQKPGATQADAIELSDSD